jgi:hypothetical protein
MNVREEECIWDVDWKSEKRKVFGVHRRRRTDNIEKFLCDILRRVLWGVDWIHLAQQRVTYEFF